MIFWGTLFERRKFILICKKCLWGCIEEKRHLQTSPANTNKKESAALFFVCLLPISLKNIGCDNMRGSMVSCSLCSRKLHMFAVRSGKPSCACLLQQETKLCMLAAGSHADQ